MDCLAASAGYKQDKNDMESNLIIWSPLGTHYLNGSKSRYAKNTTPETGPTASIPYQGVVFIHDITLTIFP